MKQLLKQILDDIYGGEMSEADCAMVIRRVHQRLERSFYGEPPSVKQNKTLEKLLRVADEVELFFKD